MKIILIFFAAISLFSGSIRLSLAQKPSVTFNSLIQEMTDPMIATRWPDPEYRSLQASSYNRESVSPDQPGWFADSDGVAWIREEVREGKTEYVIMEHEGPGCITRMWTPFFYYNFNNRIGPDIRIYLDDSREPVLNENFIALLTGKGTVRPPFADYTARAGLMFLPIPFSKSCKITLTDKAFYNIINYRAYLPGTKVQTFTKALYAKAAPLLAATASKFSNQETFTNGWQKTTDRTIKAMDSLVIGLPAGNHAIRNLTVRIAPDMDRQMLRSTVLKIRFDGVQTVWCPLGDFFCSPDTLNPFKTYHLGVSERGEMICNRIMPYASSAEVSLVNLQNKEIKISLDINIGSYAWDEQSMYFHANWAPVGPLPGNRFFDLNFINIEGKGRIIADALTVLSPGTGWWGEGDEKIYIDEGDLSRKFPSHFGTGTEDYYGWAGGVVPTGHDRFSSPVGSNVRIGNPSNPRGYNICLRNRILDDIPFKNRLIFDMEASPGTDIRNYWNLLDYSSVTWWYGMADARSNHGPNREKAAKKLMTLSEIERLQQMVKDSIVSFNTDKLEKYVRDTPAEFQK